MFKRLANYFVQIISQLYYFAVWTFETFSELLFRLNTHMSINSIEVGIYLNYKFNLQLSNFIINSSILNNYSRYF